MIIMIEDCMVEDKPSPQHECDSPMTVRFKGVRSGGAAENPWSLFLWQQRYAVHESF